MSVRDYLKRVGKNPHNFALGEPADYTLSYRRIVHRDPKLVTTNRLQEAQENARNRCEAEERRKKEIVRICNRLKKEEPLVEKDNAPIFETYINRLRQERANIGNSINSMGALYLLSAIVYGTKGYNWLEFLIFS